MTGIAPLVPETAALKRAPAQARPNLVGLPRDALAATLEAAGTSPAQARMRAGQLAGWLYQRGARDFETMTSLSKGFRAELAASFRIDRPEIVTRQVSQDGTRKYLLRIDGGHEVEAVYIPEEDRGTLCVSSQVGCTLTCSFCHTGTQKLVRNLTAAEIVGQILVCRDDLGEWPKPGERPQASIDGRRLLSNIVLMGMGEPLYNFEGVRDAMKLAMDGDGLSLSRRRITLSTSGVAPMIPRWGAEAGTLMAISLHATTDDVRDQLVPINRKWNIAALLDACRAYPRLSNAERITFEYVMLKDVNDSDADARRLVRLIAGIPAKINLIPFNAWPGASHERSSWERIEAFAEIVNRAGYASPVRTPRGQDILAACGQLKSATERGRRSAAQVAAETAAG
ncbi:23S rRNA (adenine(2503)-C(2))-methyltransferase RlmN [Rubrimonas cliftonensis]|uniref:23S rRNA (adenine(2503)-C(2))-methyltransferase RlmN n=1 Tax=Rubrimonas cliftonensis TaxID=89524 RepID=UPI000B85222B